MNDPIKTIRLQEVVVTAKAKLNPNQERLVESGIPRNVVLQGDDAIKKYAETHNIQLPATADPASAAASTTALKPKDDTKEDKVEIAKKEPSEDDKLKQKDEQRKHQTDVEFANLSGEYHKKKAAVEEAQKAADEARAAFNKVSKKTLKGKKVDKDNARAAAQKALNEAEDNLKNAKDEMKAVEKQLKDKDRLGAANDYNLKKAIEEDNPKDKKLAAKTAVDDYLKSEDGREATEQNLVTANKTKENDGARLIDDHGKAHKRGSEERKAAYDAIQAEQAAFGKDVSRKGARRIYKARIKDYNSMQKEDALKQIIIGDKDDYKNAVDQAKKGKDGFDKDKPSVTYMSEELYEKARIFAKSKGVELPTFKDGSKKVLTGEQMKEFQQLLMDEAGDVGSRLDAKERKALDKEYKGISYTDFRKMFEAGNVDVQRTYRTAAEAAGAVAGAATALATGLYDAGEAGFSLGLSGLTGGLGSGSSIVDKGEDWVPGTDGKFKWGNAALSLLVDRAVAEGLNAIASYDPNGFHKGVTLEDFILGKMNNADDAFKKLAPNVKATMAKIVADGNKKGLTNEEIYAACDRALGDANERINLRESVGANAAMRAYIEREKQDIPDTEVVPELNKRTVYDIGDGKFVDENGNSVDMKDAKYIEENQVTDKDAQAVGSRGTAYDEKVVHDKYGNNEQITRAGTKKVDENGDLQNQNKIDSKSQYTVANEKGEVEVKVGNGTVLEPDSLTLKDDTNKSGQHNKYEYVKLTNQQATAAGLDPEEGPFYQVKSALDPNGNKIASNEIGKIYKLNTDQNDRGSTYQYTRDEAGYTKTRTKSDVKQVNYHMDAVNKRGKSPVDYSKTGANPKK